jgi:hypothetical protein
MEGHGILNNLVGRTFLFCNFIVVVFARALESHNLNLKVAVCGC